MMKKWLVLILFLMIFTLAQAAQGQDEAPPVLVPGVDVTGTLDNENFAANYVFEGSVGDAITLDAVADNTALTLVLLLTAPNGAVVARDVDLTTPNEALIGDFSLPQNGQYVVTIMRGDGASGTASGGYTLAISGSLTPPPMPEVVAPATQTIPTDAPPVASLAESVEVSGVEIVLNWSAAVNFNLEVRDPQGGAIFRGSSPVASGGTLAADVNADCATATDQSPTETISWGAGAVPTGSYEIIIYYVDACTVGGPQQFALSAAVDGDEPRVINGTLNPSQQYLAALDIETAADWSLFNGGVNAGLDVSLLSSQVAAAQPLAGTSVTDTLNRQTPAIAYTFEGLTGDTVSLTMDRVFGNLDPYLILLGPTGVEIARNDDRDATTINSGITTQLTQDGIYTIVATRYGQTIGGTEGDFNLSLSLSVAGTTPSISTAAPVATAESGEVVAAATPTPLADGTNIILRPEGLPQGSVEIILTWNTTADLQLLVRDPSGEAIFDDNPDSTSGGILAQTGNARCEAGNTAPVSYVYWPATRLPRGIFEVEVWYQDTCNDPNPVTFNLVVNVQGQNIINEQQPTTVDSRYAITFEIDQESNATAAAGGFFDMESASTLDYFSRLSSATPIEYGDTVPGSITASERVVLYSFEGQTGDRILINMQRTGGTLDTALFLISPEGNQLANNDDIVDPVTGERNTNSAIEGVTLRSIGTYYIIATHYGLQFGGTTGTYNLTLFELPPG